MDAPLRVSLDAAEPRPTEAGKQSDKKNYAERLSRQIATMVANGLRREFPGIIPDERGGQQESLARTAKGVKRLDVNYSTPELGLGLGVSIKTINFRDAGSKRYTKNYTRVDNELRAEAMDYHLRQPYSVLIAFVFLPADACDDGTPGNPNRPSSFGSAVRTFRNRSLRSGPKDQEELLERVLIGLYEHSGEKRGEVWFFDVKDSPPISGRPLHLLSFDEALSLVTSTYDQRNKPPFGWADYGT